MAKRVIVLSGAVASGKTALASALQERFGCHLFKTRHLIQQELPHVHTSRRALQEAGEKLDRRTRGKWVGRALGRAVAKLTADRHVLVDSVRIEEQIAAIRAAFGAWVVHIHLTASLDELRRRYRKRSSSIEELPSYDEVRSNETEARIDELKSRADVVIDTDRCTLHDVVVRAAGHLGFYGRSYDKLVDVLVGGQWGSEGKGHLADYLCREYDVLVRVGGPNAGHTIYQEPETVVFHHLPSGTLSNPEAQLVLGPGAVLGVPRLLEEIAENSVSSERLFIDPQAVTIEDADVQREEELRQTIASTKQGVGLATSRKVLRTKAEPPVRLAQDVPELEPYLQPTHELLADAFRAGERVFLEGTQGTGLSLHHGKYPFVTSRDTTVSGCLAEAGIAPSRVRRIVMLCRSYPIRVGGPSGPMGREISWAEIARRSGIPARRLRKSERGSTTGRLRRVAEFSWEMLRRAASLNGPTDLALSFTDYLAAENRKARRFEQLSRETIEFIEEIERVAAAPVSLIVTRFHHRSVIDRRRWGAR